MRSARLALAFPDGAPGRTLLIGAEGGEDLSVFDPARTLVVETMAHHHAALKARGFSLATEIPETGPDGAGGAPAPFDTALVTLPRSRNAARARIASAAARLAPDGMLWIDGQKTDGIESLLKEMRGMTGIAELHSKAHGKIARLADPGAIPPGWTGAALSPAPGFTTRPGLFSAEAVDPGSAALAAALPQKLPTRIVDLGAGWGWLSAQILQHPGVETLHLVEADHVALSCARINVTDPRAQFHWQDARQFRLPDPVNGVIMNPPFHQGRAADPGLGAAFIGAAAGLLTGAGRLWMVANRHLPYEAELAKHFSDVSEIGGDTRFKILSATGAGARNRRRR
ncbi:16S rRNA (guanine1207-N2)-methyltransferase [Paracoccus isoporae]|uniref:16S rRNA (Guanine1207-N2)-methyltransferase n=1 Tax=Paracoccus isoporae TaxID=591205 RepID=A0A1G7DJA8_9RHOB|nr:methyltransferase [Paracoccus isoporae]SDE51589.1 16S rRNA (guanine1207-N2)-methyltransferase [Paracoccus isoporae]